MSQPRCDLYNNKNKKWHCSERAYAEAYWKKGGWSYLCSRHFKERRRKMKFWSFLDEEWVWDQFILAIRKIENKFGICQSKNDKWCLAVEFNDKISDLSKEIFESVEKHK